MILKTIDNSGNIGKSFLNSWVSLFSFSFLVFFCCCCCFFLATGHLGTQFADQGLKPCPLHCKHTVLTTGSLGKSEFLILLLLVQECCVCPNNINTPSVHACVCAQLRPTVCDPEDCSPPGSSVHGIFWARILERVAISYSRGPSRPRDWTCISYIGRWILYD